MTSSNGDIARVTGSLCGQFTGHRWILPQRTVTRSFDFFFELLLNKWLSKQSWGWWFETPSLSSWRASNEHGEAAEVVARFAQFLMFQSWYLSYCARLITWTEFTLLNGNMADCNNIKRASDGISRVNAMLTKFKSPYKHAIDLNILLAELAIMWVQTFEVNENRRRQWPRLLMCFLLD